MTSTACMPLCGNRVTAVHPCRGDRTQTFVAWWMWYSDRLFHWDVVIHLAPAGQAQWYVGGAKSAPKDAFRRRVPPTWNNNNYNNYTWNSPKVAKFICAVENRMSGDAEPQNSEQALGPPPRKVMRRIGHAHSVSDMGVLGAVQHLKSEVRQLKAVGYTALFHGEAPVLQSHLSSYLSGSSARAYDDPHGCGWQDANSTEYPKFGEQASAFSFETGTIKMNFSEELCFNLHCDLVERLKTTTCDGGEPGLFLDSAAGQPVKKTGGFQESYKVVNVRAMRFSKAEQDRCIFGFTQAEYLKVVGQRGKYLADEVKSKVTNKFKKNATIKQVHALFHWNDHSFFTYHQDEKGDVAVVVNLSPCETDFHVAGMSKSAAMTKPGMAQLVPTQVYHRSGKAPRRCIKLVFFLDLAEPVDLSAAEEPAAASATNDKDTDGKEEKQDVFENEGTTA